MAIAVEIPPTAWRADSDDRTRLKATLVINGVPFHLEAVAVEVGGDRVQQAVDSSDDRVAVVHDAVGADGHWATLGIGGREYVLIATPFC